MIQTTKESLARFSSLNPYFPAAFAALEELEKDFSAGRHPVDGDNVYVNAAEYDTRDLDGAQMEAHRKYIDVMWMVSGEEIIGYCPVEELTEVTMPYDDAGDAFLAKITRMTKVEMKAGDVCILFPEDGHAPSLHPTAGPSHVKKFIAKVRVV